MMAVSTTKKVRLSPELEADLALLAKELGVTESEVLRYGIRLAKRVRDRRANIAMAVEEALAVPGDKIRWEGKP